jgi:CheY-like chemotaxis protein
MLIGDDQRLAQVITNLPSNAVKFTPESGSVSLHLRYIGEEDRRCAIQVEVADTGIGISQEQQDRLFTSFEQAESSTSRKFGGTELGLIICKKIVGLMDGDIGVNSELGKGATFIFTAKLKKTRNESGSAVPTVMKGISILFVDNDPDMREYFCEIVQRMGITCITAADGREALDRLKQSRKYDICFVDWMIPGMDGIELCREIKAAGIGGPLIIMVSAYDWISIEQIAMDAGINGFLSKPFFSSDILNCISNHVGSKIFSISDSSKSEPVESFKGYRILLVEDVEINREIVQSLLEPTQLEIDCAVNGSEAVKFFGDSPDRYDMLLMDMQMPGMDGLTATRRIRAMDIAKAKEIPIVAMTANVFKDDVEKCIDAGMNDHIGKPIDLGIMLSMLRKYLRSAPEAQN